MLNYRYVVPVQALFISRVDWKGDPFHVRIVVTLMIVWRHFGYSMLFYLAVLATIPKDLYEAADVDGASAVRKFAQITWPMLRPVTVFIIPTSIIGGFRLLEEPILFINGFGESRWAMVGGPERAALTVVWNLYDTAFGTTSHLGLGSAMAYGLCVDVIKQFERNARSACSSLDCECLRHLLDDTIGGDFPYLLNYAVFHHRLDQCPEN